VPWNGPSLATPISTPSARRSPERSRRIRSGRSPWPGATGGPTISPATGGSWWGRQPGTGPCSSPTAARPCRSGCRRAPDLVGLQAFIDAYRTALPYDASGADPARRLTIDLAAGDRWLIDIGRKATADWLRTDAPVLDHANAMVPARQPSVSSAIANWQEHVDGKAQYSPVYPPLAPAKFTGSLYVAEGSQVRAECTNFDASVQKATASFVQTVAPRVGATRGMLGFMFWAAERPSTRGVTTAPPNTCEGGIGRGATAFSIPIPMPPLRQN
jgi:hypothetical protein